MKKILLPIVLIVLVSCSLKLNPLKNNYQDGTYQITTKTNKDAVWDKIIDLFSSKGLPIKLIDRSSGLIISERSDLVTTYETKKGELSNSKAWVVVPTIKGTMDRKGDALPYYNNVSGEWNIRIKNDEAGNCLVNVNIVNLQRPGVDARGYPASLAAINAKSTGVFEKTVADLIK